MPLNLYYDLLSQPSRTLYIFLRMNDIPFESKLVALRKAEHYGEEFKKINPFSLVPVIDDDGFKLTESIAIAKYIIRKYDLPEHWFPQRNLKSQARVEEYLHWHHFNTRFSSGMLFRELAINPRMSGKPADLDTVDKLRQRATTMVSRLETYFLKDRNYLAGDKISLADIFVICELMQLYACHEEAVCENSPIVKAWMERIKRETNPYFDEAHKMLYRLRDAYKQMSSKL